MKSSTTQFNEKKRKIKDHEKLKNRFCLAGIAQSSLKQLARKQHIPYRIATFILTEIDTFKKYDFISLFVSVAKNILTFGILNRMIAQREEFYNHKFPRQISLWGSKVL